MHMDILEGSTLLAESRHQSGYLLEGMRQTKGVRQSRGLARWGWVERASTKNEITCMST